MEMLEVIKRPLLTEKTNTLKAECNHVSFEVHPKASKTDIKRAVESIFEVKVAGVSTAIVHGKFKTVGRFRGRTGNWKKAIVSLKPGESLELFDGV